MTQIDKWTPGDKPRRQIVVTDGHVGLMAVLAVLAAGTFLVLAADTRTGVADAPMRIEALPLPNRQ